MDVIYSWSWTLQSTMIKYLCGGPVFNMQHFFSLSRRRTRVETALDLPNHGKLRILGRVLHRCEAVFSPIAIYRSLWYFWLSWTITDCLAISFDILSTVDKFVFSLLDWVSLTNCIGRAGCSIRTVWFSDLPTGTCSILNSWNCNSATNMVLRRKFEHFFHRTPRILSSLGQFFARSLLFFLEAVFG